MTAAPRRRGAVLAIILAGYLLGIAAPMVVVGIGQGLGLRGLTTAGMAGVQPRDAAAGPDLASRVSATLTAACAFLVLALAITLASRRQRNPSPCRSPGAPSTRRRARPTGSPGTSTSMP